MAKRGVSMFARVKTYLLRFGVPLGGERGQTLTEYALLLLFVVIACFMALGLLGIALLGRWEWIIDRLPF